VEYDALLSTLQVNEKGSHVKKQTAILLIGTVMTIGISLADVALAGVLEYTSASSFSAATASSTTYNFDGLVSDDSFTYQGKSLSVGPATFNGNGELFLIGANAGLGEYGVPYLSLQYGNPNTLIVSTHLTTAIAFNYGSYYNINDILMITLSDESVFDISLPSVQSKAEFVGVTSSTPISSFSFVDKSNSSNEVLDITDFTLGTAASAVPELSTWVMMLLGFAGAGFAAYHKLCAGRTALTLLN
jgi:hypothetical protein